MGMSSGDSSGGSKRSRVMLAEINVTPLVDVMLVLLIIFMVSAGVQNVEMQVERQKVLEEAEQILEEARKEKLDDKDKEKPNTKVNIDLPKVDSEVVILTEVKKLQLVVTAQLKFSIEETVVLDCPTVSPGIVPLLATKAADQKALDRAFEPCLKRLGEKLVDNHKLQEDKELYLLADRALDYGLVLKIMAAIRQAGATKFGLVAEPGTLGGATVAPTEDPLNPEQP